MTPAHVAALIAMAPAGHLLNVSGLLAVGLEQNQTLFVYT